MGIRRLPVFLAVLLSLSLVAGFAAGEAVAAGHDLAGVNAAERGVERGEPLITADKAMQIARGMFPELLEGKDVNIEMENAPFMRFWRLDWNAGAAAGRQRGESFCMSIDADTGALVNMRYDIPAGYAESGATPVTLEEARQKAEEFAGKFRPVEFTRVRQVEKDYLNYYQPDRMKNFYDFYWERVENGILVAGDGINVAVDALSGRVINFSASWHDDADFPEPGAWPEGLAQKALKEVGLILSYQVLKGGKTGPSGTPEASLVYQLNSPGFLRIDPYSGDALSPEGKKVPLGQHRLFTGLPAPAADGAAPTGPDALIKPVQKISRAEAQEAARRFFDKLGLEGEVVHGGGGSSNDGVFIDEEWQFNLQEEDRWGKEGPRRHVSVGINVFTGEIKSFYDSDYFEYAGIGRSPDAPGKAVTRDAARAKAIDFIRLVHPEKLGQVVEEQSQEYSLAGSKNRHHFTFVRLVNGIPFQRDGITVALGANGNIVRYDVGWHTAQFSDAGGIISREEAEKIYLENVPLKPVYYFPQEKGKLWEGKVPVLSLAFDDYWGKGIDARTGQVVTMNWRSVQPEKKNEPMVSPEHWAAASLALLAESGLLPGEGFEPDGPVSRRDALRVLISSAGNYQSSGESAETGYFSDIAASDRDYHVIQAAVRWDILDSGGSFFPDQPVARETLAVWLVRALGYNEVAGMPAKIELKSADAERVSEECRNYVAIACGIGLMKGDENSLFRPADHATWAELAALVTRNAPRLRTVIRW